MFDTCSERRFSAIFDLGGSTIFTSMHVICVPGARENWCGMPGDVDKIDGFDCEPGDAFDLAALYLAGRGGLWVDHLTAVHQGGFV